MRDDAARDLARRQAEDSADFVAAITEIPLGSPAPYYGWGRGESTVISGRSRLPDAIRCTRQPCSARFQNARIVTVEQYLKDPDAFAGTDVRLQSGSGPGLVACNVRYNRERGVTTLTLGINTSSVSATAPGRQAAQDPNMADNSVLEVGAAVSPPGQEGDAGGIVIFEYFRRGSGSCRRSGGD